MNRAHFLKVMALSPLLFSVGKLSALGQLQYSLKDTPRMPVLFLGHGSPMNAIEENQFVQGFRNVAKKIPQPTAILCVSAHWETRGTYVTAMEQPRTIHDFGGFPQALFDVQYPAAGSPELAKETQKIITSAEVLEDHQWGLDHGTWSVVKHLYPNADISVVQLSLDRTKPASYHYALARELATLRRKGVLIIGSGNMVHNLGKVAWNKLNEDGFGFDWALEADECMKQYIQERNHTALVEYEKQGKAFQLAIPTPEHYLPLLYALALQEKDEDTSLFNDKAVGGSLTMTSVHIHS